MDNNPNFDDQLKSALRRQEAPPDFANQVLARAAQQSSAARRDPWWKIFSQPMLRWATAGVLTAALLAGGFHYRQLQQEKIQRERAEGEAAKQRLILALRIAGSKLQLARTKVNQISANETDPQQEKE